LGLEQDRTSHSLQHYKNKCGAVSPLIGRNDVR
jgi:hypothetical protein